jgi:hypothetical protein
METDYGFVFLIEFLTDRCQLPAFKLGDFDRTPSLGSADERAKHQFQDSSLPEGIGDDLEATENQLWRCRIIVRTVQESPFSKVRFRI